MLFKQFQRARLYGVSLVVFASCFTSRALGQPQTFTSGSTGADGALNVTAPGVIYFNPAALNLNPSIPNVFNFTTITIAAGSTLKFTEEVFHGPVFFLAQGDVVVGGTLDLTGQPGQGGTANQSDRLVSYAGSGGFGGGLGGGPGGTPVAEPGNGPGGGLAGSQSTFTGGNAKFTGNQYLVPLVGGSGGGGAAVQNAGPCFGPSGGAGGGAILIASSTTITVNGVIDASGGGASSACNASGYGSGGGIRLVANAIAGSGAVRANFSSESGSGQIRFEALTQSFTGSTSGTVSQSVPFAIALPATAPGSLSVTSVNGVSIHANPFSFPDTTINTSGSVVINIQAQYIPPGTVPTLTVFSETGPDQMITCSPLSGTLQQSTSTATVTFPVGGSRGFVKATWSH